MTPQLGRSLPSVQQLLAVREVAARGSTSRAAKALFRSQPAITQAVAQMEQRFATDLFIRTPTGMIPSAAGGLIIQRVKRALDYLADGIRYPRLSRTRAVDVLSTATIYAISGAQMAAIESVVAAGGFEAAARATGLSRAGLHRCCRALERALGLALFESTSHGIEATREALTLARQIGLAGAELRQAAAEAGSIRGLANARIVIGALPLARTALVPDAVLQFAKQHACHTVTILDGPYEAMLSALRRGDADMLVGALREPLPNSDIEQEYLFDDPLAIVVRAAHPILALPFVNAQVLQTYPWVAPRLGTPLRRQFESIFESMAFPDGLVECNSLSAARALLRNSNHVMLSSAHQVGPDLELGALALVPQPAGLVLRRIGITTRKGWHPTLGQTQFLQILRTTGRLVNRPAPVV